MLHMPSRDTDEDDHEETTNDKGGRAGSRPRKAKAGASKGRGFERSPDSALTSDGEDDDLVGSGSGSASGDASDDVLAM